MLADLSQEPIPSIADKAVSQIRALDLPFDPPMFELWFNYYSGTNRNLCAAIDQAILKELLSYKALIRLYDAFLCSSHVIDRVRVIGEGLQEQTSGTLGAIAVASELSHGFQEKLQQAASEFEETDGATEMKCTVSALLRSTEEAHRTSAALQNKLLKSAEQVRMLQDRLDIVHRETMSDPLTGVANRRMFDSSLRRLINQADEQDSPISLIFIDVDRFKHFNDQYGHQVGDDVLRLVSTVIKQNCRADDVVCRFGGDEFAVILPNTSIEGALVVAEKLRHSVMKRQLLKRSTREIMGQMTISIGAAQHRKNHSSEALVARADKWLYSAKRNGRNCVNAETHHLIGLDLAEIDRNAAYSGVKHMNAAIQ